jgi:hypothetical protein
MNISTGGSFGMKKTAKDQMKKTRQSAFNKSDGYKITLQKFTGKGNKFTGSKFFDTATRSTFNPTSSTGSMMKRSSSFTQLNCKLIDSL